MPLATKTKTVTNYHTRFIDPQSGNTHSITSEDLNSLQNSVRHVLGNSVQFEPSGEGYLVLYKDRSTGWISKYSVSEDMSNKQVNSFITSQAA